ncbi:MAG: magnesium and cobalt efflux protein CorC [Rhodocyclales bacterium]|nr:magnesium and cobalt efflux protein CorC [Rhodocyclales bacterium]
MDDFPLSAQLALLALLLVSSGFFSLAETTMMAANRYRLKSAAAQGVRGAQLALNLLAETDRLLGVVLLFNNLINAASATLVSIITIRLFGESKWALGLGTLAVTFLILVFAEITPKVIGANHSDKLAPYVAYVLAPLLRASHFVVAFINLFVTAMLRLMRIKPVDEEAAQALSPEELRMLVLESSHFIPPKHRSILLNLFELEEVTVEDVMVPRGSMEALDLAESETMLREQIGTSYHSRLPVFFEEPNNVLGILQQRRLLPTLLDQSFDRNVLRELLVPAYFIPANTPVYAQLQFFQENHQRMGLVVDEYGEILGLVTMEDIIEELIGKFTTSVPGADRRLSWDKDGSVTVDGSRSLRELNRLLGLNLPLEGPKTLNGLVLEHLEDIPESGVSVKVAGVPIEVLQTEDRRVKTVRLFRPARTTER